MITHHRAKSMSREITQKYGIRKNPAARVHMILQRVPMLPTLPITLPEEAKSCICTFVAIGPTAQSTKLMGVRRKNDAKIEAHPM